MSGLKHFALDPASVKLIQLIAGMTAERRSDEADFQPPIGRKLPSEEARGIAHDPMGDGGDAVDPAWLRGCDHGVEATIEAVNRVLDEIERGAAYAGHFEDASLEALKNRLHSLMAHRL
jgi:hypothetical protein